MAYIVKGAIATVDLGTTAAGAYFGSVYFSDKSTISNHLTNSGYTLISSITNKEHARKQWEAEFESDEQNIKTLIGFVGSGKEQGGEALEKWCSSKLKENYSETHRDLDGVKKYCTIRSINSQLTRKGTSILTNGEGDKSKWTNTYNKRKSTTNLSPRSQIAELEGEWSGVSHNESSDLEEIKPWCTVQSKISFYAYESTYDQVYNWCTEGGASVEETLS